MKIFFFKPKKKDILIYSEGSLEPYLKKILDKSQYNIVSILGILPKYINFYVLIFSIFKTIFFRVKNLKLTLNLKVNYYVKYLELTKPKIVITTIDDEPLYYFLKNFYPQADYIGIQNGKRQNQTFHNINEISKKNKFLKNPRIDYFFCFGELYKKLVEKNLFSVKKVFSIGSARNNSRKIKENDKKTFITIISEYMVSDYTAVQDGMLLPNSDYYKAEKKILPLVSDYCMRNKFHLKILTRYTKEQSIKGGEIKFYKKYLNNYKKISYSFRNKIDTFQNYRKLDECKFAIAFGTSSFDMEAMARGCKVAILNKRAEIIKNLYGTKECQWAWPKKQHKEGVFWSTRCNKKDVVRILNYVKEASKLKWSQTLKKNKIEDCVSFDHNNKKLKELISSLLV